MNLALAQGPGPAPKSEELLKLEAECATNGLACAKAAYQHKRAGNMLDAYKFYQKAANLRMRVPATMCRVSMPATSTSRKSML